MGSVTDGPAATLPEQAPSVLALVLRLAEGHAALQERVRTLERTLPEVAARLEGRFTSVEAQIGRQADHLAQQDQAAERARLEQKSQWGTLQQAVAGLTAAEQQRAEDAREAERRRNAQAVALAEEARRRHVQAASRVRQTVAYMATFAASAVLTELAGLPLRVRLLCLAAGAVVALGWVLLDYLRTRPARRTP